MPVAAIILAAGESRRLGQPKQLLQWGGETLLNRAIRMATEAGAGPVLSVLGARYDSISASVQPDTVIKVHNDRWRQGIGASIEAGMRALAVCAPESAGVLLMSCDQPRLSAEHLRLLMHTFESEGAPGIAASAYGGVRGVPAVFPRETFEDLRSLHGDRGARAIIERGLWPVVAIEFEGGEVDIDVPEDLRKLG